MLKDDFVYLGHALDDLGLFNERGDLR